MSFAFFAKPFLVTAGYVTGAVTPILAGIGIYKAGEYGIDWYHNRDQSSSSKTNEILARKQEHNVWLWAQGLKDTNGNPPPVFMGFVPTTALQSVPVAAPVLATPQDMLMTILNRLNKIEEKMSAPVVTAPVTAPVTQAA